MWIDNGAMSSKEAVKLGRQWAELRHAFKTVPLHNGTVRVFLKTSGANIMIDYEQMKRVGQRQKVLLTRCKNIANPELRYSAVKNACVAAVKEWNDIGAWPDNWSLWQRALDDAFFAMRRVRDIGDSVWDNTSLCPRLEEL